MTVCPTCGHETEGAKFCPECGTALTASAPAPREERKVVTVLFADLVGFTARAETMDPEDVRALLAPYHARLRAELERFGGTVEKFIGDAVMALFGAPVAHEDDPERAVRAALSIRDWIGDEEDLQVRIGVNTGEALVALGARPEAGEGMASGDVVNTAARLQAAAPPNGILVGEATYRATEQVIDYRAHSPVDAKGKEAPVLVWEPIEARSRFGVDVMRAPATELVGREREVDALRDAFDRALRHSVQLVTLVGVPGIGKSRLVFELMEQIRTLPDLVTWRQGRSLSYGEGVSLWAFGEIVKAQAGALEDDTPDVVATKVHESVAALVPSDDAQWIESHLRTLIGLEGDEQPRHAQREESFSAWTRYVEALAERDPTVLVFEDLHWADDGLLDFISHLSEWADDVPLLIVGTARPELFDRRPDWGGGKRNATTLALSPLDPTETSRLLAALLDRAVLPADVQSELLERAEGNPLYAEQYVRMLAEGGDFSELPETVQGIIAARLDGLARDEKDAIQNAAVLGKTFTLAGLERVADIPRRELERVLQALDRKEFVRRERRPSISADAEYSFRHVLVRDVAYSQIPRRARAEKHVGAAAWIDSLGRPRDHAELLAYHYESALDLTTATGGDTSALVEPALRALHAAGERAMSLNAFTRAETLYRRALDLSRLDDPERPALLTAYGRAVWANGGDAAPLLEEARATAADAETAAEAETYLAQIRAEEGSNEQAFEHLERALARVRERPATPAKAIAFSTLARYLAIADRPDEAVEVGREALSLAETLGLEEYRIQALHYLGLARASADRAGGIADLERSIELARAANSPFLTYALNNLASLTWAFTGIQRPLEIWDESRAVAERVGLRQHLRWLDGIDSACFYVIGRWDDSLRLADAVVGYAESGSPQYLEQSARMMRALIHAARDDVARARPDIERAIAQVREVRDPQAVVPTLCSAISAVALIDGAEAAMPYVDEYLDVLSRYHTSYFFGWFAEPVAVVDDLGRGDDFLAIVNHESSAWMPAIRALLEHDYVRAADLFAEIGSLIDEALTRLRAARALGDQAQLRQALTFFRSVGATRYVREAEAVLAAAS